jgi:hypothetical protein
MKQSETTFDAKLIVRESIVSLATAVWIVGFIGTLLSLSVPPADIWIWVGLLCISLVAACLGVRRRRVFGLIATFLSLVFIGLELLGGKQIRAQRERAATHAVSTNSPAVSGPK